jgi:uncharacterized membrane protein required for colicin V production
MTPYDAAMVGVIVAGMVWGAFKGITWQVASLSSLIVGYIASHTLSSQIAPYFPGEPVVARTLAMIATYIGVSGAIFFVAWLIRATLHRLKFEAFDRHLGMLLGGAEAGFVGMVVTLFVVSLAPQTRGPIFASPSGRIVSTVMATVGPVLPAEAREELAPFLTPGSPTLASDPRATAATAEPPTSLIPNFGRAASGSPDSASKPETIGDMIEDGEKRIGEAIANKATEQLQQTTGAGPNGRTTNRR